jgi:hypothetical protein
MSDASANMPSIAQDWFANLTGFREESYELTRSRLRVEDDELVSTVNGKRYGIGHLTLPTLGKLRWQADLGQDAPSTVRCVTGDVRAMHSEPEFERAMFQVASQFNLLEMTGPNVTPEDGVTPYSTDHTQGPACAIAAGAATIYRNYFVPVDDEIDMYCTMTAEVCTALRTTELMPASRLSASVGEPMRCHLAGTARLAVLLYP